jgi:hypothetical protein
MMRAASATAAAEPLKPAPSASHHRASTPERSLTTSGGPAAIKRSAIGLPIVPSPTNPIVPAASAAWLTRSSSSVRPAPAWASSSR